nr:GGDEF domain-containing protein [Lachnospiraceae bacterium]
MDKKRLNIALLVSEFEDAFVRTLCEGAIAGAKEIDANLFIYPGKYIDADFNDIYRTRYDYQYNSLFEYAMLEDMDVFAVCLGTIGANINMERRLEFLKRFQKPIVVIADRTEGFPNASFDNKTGLKKGIRHLIEEHGRRNIGFVSGPPASEDAKERLSAYREALKECDIPYREDYIVYGNFSEFSEEVVRALMKKNPNLDAVVFANDRMAIGGYKVFKELGLDIGEDISVLGFDDAVYAMTLDPNLSTVKADAGDLAYQAVVNIESVISGELGDIVIPSVPVMRASCGCRKRQVVDFDISPEEMFDKDKADQNLFKIYDYLFGKNQSRIGSSSIKKHIEEYYTFVVERVATKEVEDFEFGRMFHLMQSTFNMELEPYTSTSKISAFFESIYNMLKRYMDDDRIMRKLSETYYTFYSDVVAYQNKVSLSDETDVDLVTYIATTFTRDIMNFSIGDDRAYFSIMEKLESLHYISAYLCMFPKKVIRRKDEEYKIPDHILMKTYLDRGELGWMDVEEQKRDMKGLVTGLYGKREQRVTVIVNLLFSTLEQYGLFISEIDERYLHNSVPVAYQMSAAVKTIELLKENASMMDQLKKNIEEIKEKNLILDEISKSDELTQIYNRRGFLATTQRQIIRAANKGKKAFVIYADMNNLKIINDRFGHEEGDYSLRLIAEILKESFDEKSIVGRFGGDEFVAFAFASEENTPKKIRMRIFENTKKKNEGNGKPYFVSMSVGICEFECSRDANLKDLMDKADVDLYIEKKHKRSNVLKNENEAI